MAETIEMKSVRFERAVNFTEPGRRGETRFAFKYSADDVRNRTVIEIPEWLYDELKESRRLTGAPKIVDAKPGSEVDHTLDKITPPGTPLSDEEIELTKKPAKRQR